MKRLFLAAALACICLGTFEAKADEGVPVAVLTEEGKMIMLSENDEQMLMRLAQAEAEDQGAYGKALVMEVVLNRVASSAFPNSVEAVIYEKNQFSVIKDGRYKSAVPDAECLEALEMVYAGEADANDAVWFRSDRCRSTWHDRHCEYLFTYKNHIFYR